MIHWITEGEHMRFGLNICRVGNDGRFGFGSNGNQRGVAFVLWLASWFQIRLRLRARRYGPPCLAFNDWYLIG